MRLWTVYARHLKGVYNDILLGHVHAQTRGRAKKLGHELPAWKHDFFRGEKVGKTITNPIVEWEIKVSSQGFN